MGSRQFHPARAGYEHGHHAHGGQWLHQQRPYRVDEHRSRRSGYPDHYYRHVDQRGGSQHRLRFEPEEATGGLKPYLHVRRDLWAKVTRALFYDLVELGEERDVDGERMFGVASAGEFFAMAPADALQDIM